MKYDVINWSEVSRLLSGDRTAISKTRCPKKYRGKMKRIEKAVDKLIEELMVDDLF